MENIQKKKKLLKYRLHQLTDEELCSDSMVRSAADEENYPGFEFRPLRKKDYFSPEKEMEVPMAPMDLYNELGEAITEEERQVEQGGFPSIPEKERNLPQMREERRDLEDPEAAMRVLGVYSERFEEIADKVFQIKRGLKSITDEIEKKKEEHKANVEIVRTLAIRDKIYHTMNTAIIPIFKTHRRIIWAVQQEIKRTTKESSWYTTPEEIEELNAKYPRREPFRYETTSKGVRFLRMREFKDRWVDDREEENKIYQNMGNAVASAWQSYERALRLKGEFLIRYAQQDNLLMALESLANDMEVLAQAASELAERDRQTEMALGAELEMPKAAKLISPDNFSKIAVETLDEFLQPPMMSDLDEEEQGIPPAQPIMDDGTLEPIPVDDDEFLRLKFPENDRMPESMWAKIQFAGAKNLLISITYTKITPPEEGMTKSYVVEPYSFRLKRPRRTGGGSQYYFFAYDTEDHHIKGFIYRRIQSIEILPESFDPRWEVEFHWAD